MKRSVDVNKITSQLGINTYVNGDDTMPKLGELAFCQRYGFGIISAISDCGWWYHFEGEDVAVNKPSVRKATKSEIEKWRNEQCRSQQQK